MTEHAARGPTGAFGIRRRGLRHGALALVGLLVVAGGAPEEAAAKGRPQDRAGAASDTTATPTGSAASLGSVTDRLIGDLKPTNIPTTGDDFAAFFEGSTGDGSPTVEEQLGLTGLPWNPAGAGVRVAVLDGGFRLDHPALAGRLVGRGLDVIERDDDAHEPGNGRDDDGDGRIDGAVGHGTFVAGMVLRIAPESEILPVRVSDDEGRTTDRLIALGIEAACAAGADVINLSLGSAEQGLHNALHRAIRRALDRGVAVVVAAGNDGRADLSFLAGLEGVVAVCAVDSTDGLAPFSNYTTAPTGGHVLCAPGVDLVGPAGIRTPDDFACWSGTSFAAGLASGCVAVVRSADRREPTHDLLMCLCMTAAPVRLADGSTLPVGGRIDLAAAVSR